MYYWIFKNKENKFLLVKTHTKWWKNMWSFPYTIEEKEKYIEDKWQKIAQLNHSVTTHKITAYFYISSTIPPKKGIWVSLANMQQLSLPKPSAYIRTIIIEKFYEKNI